eukprot:5858097-Pleurochrysis_carterae.AAC.1
MCNAWVCRGEVISAPKKNGNCAYAQTASQGLVANKPGKGGRAAQRRKTAPTPELGGALEVVSAINIPVQVSELLFMLFRHHYHPHGGSTVTTARLGAFAAMLLRPCCCRAELPPLRCA